MRKDDSKPYDLEERTFEFAKASRAFVKRLPRTIGNIEDAKQFIRASGSIGANYIEANQAIGKRDFVMKIKTCRREAKESEYWLRLVHCDGELDSARAKARKRSHGVNEDFRRHCSEIGGVNLNFEFGICFGIRISDFGF
jgi:four helix bundle protein